MKNPDAKILVKYLRPGDGIVLVLFLALALGSFRMGNRVGAKGKIGANLTASITVNNREVATVALNKTSDLNIQGALGKMTLQIEKNSIRVRRSACPNQVCVGQGAAQRSGAMLVCVPNRLVVLLRGETTSPADRTPQESRGDAVTH